jgi:molybdenum cofactor guanylyltransferase
MLEHTTTLAILAGGAGTRMGKPKGLLRVNDQPILEHLLDRFGWPGPSLLITTPGREHPPGWERFDREAADPVPGQGPLRGILTALENARTEWVVVTAVDMPMTAPAHVRWLIEHSQSLPDASGVMLAHKSDGLRQVEPFPGIFHARAAAILSRRIEAGLRSVSALVDEAGFFAVDVNWEPGAWLNLNHPSDLTDLAKRGVRVT